MAEFILKDRYGKDRSFDKETIFVQGADGELMQFTHGAGNPNIESLEITENGTYTAPEGVDGYNPVVVNVAGSSADLRYVTFMSYDGLVEYGKKAVAVGDDCADPIARGIFNTPSREYDGTYDYDFISWTTEIGGISNGDELLEITEDKTLYAVFDQYRAGQAGETARWKLKNNTFTVYGSGDMYKLTSEITWKDIKNDIKSVVIEEGITSITGAAFTSCTGLTGVSIADSVENIGGNAFYNCTNLKQYINCKATVIGFNAFSASGITGITFASGTTTLDGCLQDCPNLTQVSIPNSVIEIKDGFIARSKLITTVVIPDSVETIGMNAFGGCSGLKTVTIGSGVKKIGTSCFGYSGITSVTFKNKTGWYVATTSTATSGTSISSSYLGNTSTAAKYLKTTYRDYYWFRT